MRAAFGTIKDDINPLLRLDKGAVRLPVRSTGTLACYTATAYSPSLADVDASDTQASVVPLSRSRAANREHARQIDGILQNIVGTVRQQCLCTRHVSALRRWLWCQGACLQHAKLLPTAAQEAGSAPKGSRLQ